MTLPPNSVDTLRIPTLPTSVLKVRGLLAQEGVGTAEVADALAQDPPLAVKVLRIANSVQFGAREPRTSVRAATSVLGLRTVSSIVLRAGVLSLYENLRDTDGFSVTELWKHSILTAHAAEDLARLIRRRSTDFTPQDYYTCGLLHDIGRIVLFDNFGLEYVELLRSRVGEESEAEAEARGLLGLDHAETGALAAAMWRLPPPIPDMIRFHHKPVVRGAVADLVAIVVCADRMADLVFESTDAEPSDLARKLETLPPACTPAIAVEVLQGLRRHLENLEI